MIDKGRCALRCFDGFLQAAELLFQPLRQWFAASNRLQILPYLPNGHRPFLLHTGDYNGFQSPHSKVIKQNQTLAIICTISWMRTSWQIFPPNTNSAYRREYCNRNMYIIKKNWKFCKKTDTSSSEVCEVSKIGDVTGTLGCHFA